jgi:hypothetical protein
MCPVYNVNNLPDHTEGAARRNLTHRDLPLSPVFQAKGAVQSLRF